MYLLHQKIDQFKIFLFKIFLDVKGDAKNDYKFVVQLYNPSDITKGTENIDKEQGSI